MHLVPEENTQKTPERETKIKLSEEKFEPLNRLIALLKERSATPIVENQNNGGA